LIPSLFILESCEKPEDIIRSVKEKDKRIGFAINPETAVHNVKPYLDEIDQLLVMTVNPGFYGSKFLPETLSKISEARKINQTWISRLTVALRLIQSN